MNAFATTLPKRGYQPVYTPGTRCPGCSGSAWLIGRTLAECARCETAIPMVKETRNA